MNPVVMRLADCFEENSEDASADVMAVLAHIIYEGKLEIWVVRLCPLDEFQDALWELEQRHIRGMIVL